MADGAKDHAVIRYLAFAIAIPVLCFLLSELVIIGIEWWISGTLHGVFQ